MLLINYGTFCARALYIKPVKWTFLAIHGHHNGIVNHAHQTETVHQIQTFCSLTFLSYKLE